MRSSELKAKIDAMEPETRAAFLRQLDELFVETADLGDLCFSRAEPPTERREEDSSS